MKYFTKKDYFYIFSAGFVYLIVFLIINKPGMFICSLKQKVIEKKKKETTQCPYFYFFRIILSPNISCEEAVIDIINMIDIIYKLINSVKQ